MFSFHVWQHFLIRNSAFGFIESLEKAVSLLRLEKSRGHATFLSEQHLKKGIFL
jgi:hypothetical protein